MHTEEQEQTRAAWDSLAAGYDQFITSKNMTLAEVLVSTKLIHEQQGVKTVAVIFKGDEVIAGLMDFSKQHQLTAAGRYVS